MDSAVNRFWAIYKNTTDSSSKIDMHGAANACLFLSYSSEKIISIDF